MRHITIQMLILSDKVLNWMGCQHKIQSIKNEFQLLWFVQVPWFDLFVSELFYWWIQVKSLFKICCSLSHNDIQHLSYFNISFMQNIFQSHSSWTEWIRSLSFNSEVSVYSIFQFKKKIRYFIFSTCFEYLSIFNS